MKIERRRFAVEAGLLLIVFGFLAPSVSAHTGGPPYVKVNGLYAQTNPILNTTAPVALNVGLDVASNSGIIAGTPVLFEIDEQFFPNPYAQAQDPFGMPVVGQLPTQKPNFRWDFKDGSEKQEGNHIQHIFTKSGTYIVELDAKFPGKTQDFAQVDTIQVIVIPSKDYQLPRPVIKINSQKVEDPSRDVITVKPAISITFDGSDSVGRIEQYQWDFGDEKGSDTKIATHRYSRDEYFPTVVLRVTDSNNVSVDTYALLDLPFQQSNPIMNLYYKIADFIQTIL